MAATKVAKVKSLAGSDSSSSGSLSPRRSPTKELTALSATPNNAEADEASGDEKNFKLDDFHFLSTIGTGTFGRVVLVRQKEKRSYYALKIMNITTVLKLKQVDHVKNEKEVLCAISHPFIVNMYWSHHDEKFLYMLLEFVPGGELFSLLRNIGRFTTNTANFYACEIVCGLDYLHSQKIVYRDLKPENLLLDRDGHLKITDFGFAKKLVDRTWTLCGTPEYLAPEVIMSKGHNKAVDWWALGILIFEMLVGYPPFFDENPFGIYQKILSGKIEFPRHLDSVAKDLIRKLLHQDRTRRLGCMKLGGEDVKRHRWFRGINWDDVLARKLEAPNIPKLLHDGDTKNFDEYPEDDWRVAEPAAKEHQELFSTF
ncbi:cAMP-dependent protein kinase catalytic subunit PRKX-like [Liolophura sinensis]|uniref:cAMP-dependent protein kinase catalytic subunit PRKX-like n=1 Tax=Liolophura sinensis TaxID=3198878 RepID=UPI0031586D1D